MALDFPNNPTFNQQFAAPNGVTYVWDGTKWSVLSGGGGGGGGGGVSGAITVDSVAINPAAIASNTSYSRLGLNQYVAPDGSWHYLQNGAGGTFNAHTSSPAGAGSRIAFGIADINNAGPGAPAFEEGVINFIFGPPGGGGGNQYVVIGDQTHIPPANPAENTLIAGQFAMESRPVTTAAGPDSGALLGLNIFNDASGTPHYLQNGAAAIIDAHDLNSGISRLSFALFDVNHAGPGAAPLVPQVGALQLVYGATGGGEVSFAVLGGSNQIPPITEFPRRNSLICTEVAIRTDPIANTPPSIPTGDRASRIGFNAFVNNATGMWQYLNDGPAAFFTVNESSFGAPSASHIRVRVGDVGTAGTTITWLEGLEVWGPSGTPLGQTALGIGVNVTGTAVTARVEIGPPNSGPGGTGRALWVNI